MVSSPTSNFYAKAAKFFNEMAIAPRVAIAQADTLPTKPKLQTEQIR